MVLLPINPVVAGEISHYYIGAEGSGRIERSSSPIGTEQFCNKQGQANPDRSDESRFGFLVSVSVFQADSTPLRTSAASIRIVKTSSVVRNISKKSPCTTLVPPTKCTSNNTFLAGMIYLTTAAAAIAPTIWDTRRKADRSGGRFPVIHSDRVTCTSSVLPTMLLPANILLTAGLNNPPLTRKKIQTVIARLNPNTNETYINCWRFGPVLSPPVVDDIFAV